MKRAVLAAALGGAALIAFFVSHGSGGATAARAPSAVASQRAAGIHTIRHVVVIMQENRSFDSYFGTYPGADGIPMRNGVPTVCAPDPVTGRCVKPYHDPANRNAGGPHDAIDARKDVNGGKMNGFIAQAGAAGSASAGTTRTTRPARRAPTSPT